MVGSLIRAALVIGAVLSAFSLLLTGPAQASQIASMEVLGGWQKILAPTEEALNGQGYMMLAGKGMSLGGARFGNVGTRKDPTTPPPNVRDHRGCNPAAGQYCKICLSGDTACIKTLPSYPDNWEGGRSVTHTPGGR